MKHSEVDINGIKAIINYVSNHFVVCCHGLYSNKDSRKYVEMERVAEMNNFSCVRFDFRGCGKSSGKFEESTLSRRLLDLEEVIDYIKSRYGEIKISLMGSSFGGMVAMLYASLHSIKPLVLISTPYKIEDIDENFAEDLKEYDFLKIASNISNVLIIHGEKDEIVPVEQARKIYEMAGEPKKLLLLNADHSFSDEKERAKALDHAIRWIRENI